MAREKLLHSEITEVTIQAFYHYFRATDMEVGLLLNFGPRAEFRRKVFAKERKKIMGI